MKNYKKIAIILIILMIIITMNISLVYAAPDSSKGFAEYDDEQAEEETKKMLEEQEKELQSKQGKSTNNYLENLQVEGYKLSPNFDKQTIDYVLNGKLNTDEINIIATPSDPEATIEGAGKIKVEADQKEFRIDVTAPSGTVRTYMIYINDEVKEEATQVPEQDLAESTFSLMEEEKNSKTDNIVSNNVIWIILAVIVIFIIIVLYKKMKKKNHKRKH